MRRDQIWSHQVLKGENFSCCSDVNSHLVCTYQLSECVKKFQTGACVICYQNEGSLSDFFPTQGENCSLNSTSRTSCTRTYHLGRNTPIIALANGTQKVFCTRFRSRKLTKAPQTTGYRKVKLKIKYELCIVHIEAWKWSRDNTTRKG